MHLSLSPYETAALADRAEALAWADFVAAAPESLRDQLGLRVEHVADATLLIAPGTPMTFFNRAIGLGMQREASAEDISAIAERFRRAGSPEWRLLWNALAQSQQMPAQMPSILAARGFAYSAATSTVKLRWGVETLLRIESECTAVEASDSQAILVAQSLIDTFGMPPFMVEWLLQIRGRAGWRMYAVSHGSEVVGGGCLFSSGDLAWMGWGAIAAPYRRQGGQSALIARRVEDAIALGARHIFSETGEPSAGESNPSLNNMMRCGFYKVASRLNIAGPSAELTDRSDTTHPSLKHT